MHAYNIEGHPLVYIGASDIGHDDILKWWDQSSISSSYWGPGMPQFVAGMLEDLLQLCKFIAIKRINTCGTTVLREAKIIANTTDYTYEIFTEGSVTEDLKRKLQLIVETACSQNPEKC